MYASTYVVYAKERTYMLVQILTWHTRRFKYSAYSQVQIHDIQATSNTLQTDWFKYITYRPLKILYSQASLQYIHTSIIMQKHLHTLHTYKQRVVDTLPNIALAAWPAQIIRRKSSNSHYKLKNVHSARVFDTTNSEPFVVILKWTCQKKLPQGDAHFRR